ncbi:MAG: DUF2807 domain-containing protein [Chitinophagaceae bacterium]|jgi:hypothetical protein|nr:DUF2807 domain-containing protein [Chitinophagaceae bacterium]
MHKFILSLFTLSLFLFTTAQESKFEDENVEKRTVSGFHSIKVTDGIDLYLTQSTEEAVAVSASRDEYKSRLKTEVEDGVLKIYYDRESFADWTSSGKRLKAYVSFKSLRQLTANAGSTVKTEGVMKADIFTLFVKSGATFRGKVEAGKLVVETESGAKSTISGSVGTFNVSANSGAKMEAYDLAAGKADIRSTSGAKVQVTVNEEMKFYTSSGGGIYYKGKGKINEVNTSLGGIIRRTDND